MYIVLEGPRDAWVWEVVLTVSVWCGDVLAPLPRDCLRTFRLFIVSIVNFEFVSIDMHCVCLYLVPY